MWLNRRSRENEPARIRLGGSLTGCCGRRSILTTILAVFGRPANHLHQAAWNILVLHSDRDFPAAVETAGRHKDWKNARRLDLSDEALLSDLEKHRPVARGRDGFVMKEGKVFLNH